MITGLMCCAIWCHA